MLVFVNKQIENLSHLEEVDGPGTHLEVVVNNIKIKDKRLVPPKPATNAPKTPSQAPPAGQRASIFFGKMMMRSATSTSTAPPEPEE